ncbi:MAG: NAD(P)/FAD-dependent oxidoreductase [Blautia sp.]
MKQKRVCVIGGGASGLIAAIFASREGAFVTLLEHNERLGKKLTATGNGRCNLTNTFQDASCYHGENPTFAMSVFKEYSMEQTVSFFSELGIYIKNRNGYLYPASNQASSVLEVLEQEARYRKVKIKLREHAKQIISGNTESPWIVRTETWQYEADCVIIACGSPASEIEGAGTGGYELAKDLGHKIIKPLPALVPLVCKGNFFSKWAGVRTDAQVSLSSRGKILAREKGEVQLTEYGISGIPVFQISGQTLRLLDQGSPVCVLLDFMPDFTREEFLDFMKKRLENCPYKTVRDSLTGLFPKKLISVLTSGNPNLIQLADRIKCMELSVKEGRPLAQAQVCQGGVSTEQINPVSMESLLCPGIYFAGEVIDIDGICGGYNLQWAWSSGALAGIHAGKEIP